MCQRMVLGKFGALQYTNGMTDRQRVSTLRCECIDVGGKRSGEQIAMLKGEQGGVEKTSEETDVKGG